MYTFRGHVYCIHKQYGLLMKKSKKKHLSGLYECLYTCVVRVCLDKCVYVWVYACRSMTVWQL